MKDSKSNFKALVAKMDALQETEQGKLTGGISALSSTVDKAGINVPCNTTNKSQCACTSTPGPEPISIA